MADSGRGRTFSDDIKTIYEQLIYLHIFSDNLQQIIIYWNEYNYLKLFSISSSWLFNKLPELNWVRTLLLLDLKIFKLGYE